MKYNKHDLYIYISDENLKLYKNIINGIKDKFEYAYVIKIKTDSQKSMIELIQKFINKHHSLHIFCETMYFTFLHNIPDKSNIYILNLKPIMSPQNYTCAAYKNGFQILDPYSQNVKRLKRFNCSTDVFNLYPQYNSADFENKFEKFDIHTSYSFRRLQIESGKVDYTFKLQPELSFLESEYNFEHSELYNLKFKDSSVVVFLPDYFDYDFVPYPLFFENILKGGIIIIFTQNSKIKEIPYYLKDVFQIFDDVNKFGLYLSKLKTDFTGIQNEIYTDNFYENLSNATNENFESFKKILILN